MSGTGSWVVEGTGDVEKLLGRGGGGFESCRVGSMLVRKDRIVLRVMG